MTERDRLSGKDVGADYLRMFAEYLAGNPTLPTGRDGTVNVTALASIVGIPKQSFYKNPPVQSLLEDAKKARGLNSWAEQRREQDGAAKDSSGGEEDGASGDERVGAATKQLRTAQRRILVLEQHNGSLIAENFELRHQVRELTLQLGRVDIMIDTGRRVGVPMKRA